MIRRAERHENEILTVISFLSKAYWQYPEDYFKIWERELTITCDYIDSHDVYLYEDSGGVLAYYSLTELSEECVVAGIRFEAGIWLDHMFVLPEKICKQIGRTLFHHCLQQLHKRDARCLKILADPYAQGFYEKMGCEFICSYPSTIAGRTTPYLQYTL